MKNHFLSLVTVFTLVCTGLSAQQPATEIANQLFEAREWNYAIPAYEKLAQYKHNTPYLYRLGECHFQLKQYAKALSYFEQLQPGKEVSDSLFLRRGQCHQYLGNYDEAIVAYTLYADLNGGSPLTQKWIDACTYSKNNPDLNDISVSGTAIIGKPLIFGTGYFKGQVFYSQSKEQLDPVQKISYPRYYWVSTETAGPDITSGDSAGFPVTSKFYLDGPRFRPGTQEVYYTGNDSEVKFSKPKKMSSNLLSSKGINTLNIYAVVENGSEAATFHSFPYNTPEYNTIHPCFSPDGSLMIFASDIPGGEGGYDLYTSRWNMYTGWGEPQNMGPFINTVGDEMNPYLLNDSILYFASNGWPGYGGGDIFEINLLHTGQEPVNAGKPLNSSGDDFGLTWINKAEAYFVSNRDSKQGEDRIFYAKKKIQYFAARGQVIDKLTLKSIPFASIQFTAMDGSREFTILTDSLGRFRIDSLTENFYYSYNASKDRYIPYFGEIRARGDEMIKMDAEVEMMIEIEMEIEIELEPEVKKDVVFSFDNILFDYDSANLQEESKEILNRLADLLLKYPEFKVEISANTDSRGNDAYNQKLSDRRAKSCLVYLTERGINPNIIISIGYGESRLINRCGNGVKCTEEEHQQNRRVDVKILE